MTKIPSDLLSEIPSIDAPRLRGARGARHVARDISYASSAESRLGRAMIRTMENLTGRVGVIRRAEGYECDVAAGEDFWGVMMRRFGLRIEVAAGSLEMIPREGPVIIVANHPYGILDGLTMGHLLSTTRGDFRILANQVFHKAEDINRVILPISFDAGREAQEQNLKTRKAALDYLSEGGAIGIFPGGTVSTAARPLGMPLDPRWRSFTARMIAKSNASVVPIHFEGQTSRLFQLASHIHTNLRMGLLIREFRRRIDTPVRIRIGAPIPREVLEARAKDASGLMDFLRKATYDLSPIPNCGAGNGYEFEARYKR